MKANKINFAAYIYLMNNNTIHILAISGSLRPNSSNGAILNIIGEMMPANVYYTIYNGIDKLPHFNPSLDNDEPAETFNQFRQALSKADGVIICTPEYAFGVPGVLKNALDWTVSSGSFNGKPVAVITASSVGNSAHASLLLTFKALGANIPEKAAMLLPFVRSKVNEKGEISDETVLQTLRILVNALVQLIENNKEEIV